MEYLIIFFLIIMIFIIYYIKQINFIRQISNKSNKIKINLFNISSIDKYKLLYYNPLLIHIYQSLLITIKSYNKYDYKSYIIFSKLKLSHPDLLFLDWFGFINGIIKYSIDTVKKLIRKKENISTTYIINIKLLNFYYKVFYTNYDKKYLSKLISKEINSKKLESNIILQNLYQLYYIQKEIFLHFFKTHNTNYIYKNMRKYVNKNIDIYLVNSILNNKLIKYYNHNHNDNDNNSMFQLLIN